MKNLFRILFIFFLAFWVLLVCVLIDKCNKPAPLEGYYNAVQTGTEEWAEVPITLHRGFYYYDDLEPRQYDSLALDHDGNTIVYINENEILLQR